MCVQTFCIFFFSPPLVDPYEWFRRLYDVQYVMIGVSMMKPQVSWPMYVEKKVSQFVQVSWRARTCRANWRTPTKLFRAGRFKRPVSRSSVTRSSHFSSLSPVIIFSSKTVTISSKRSTCIFPSFSSPPSSPRWGKGKNEEKRWAEKRKKKKRGKMSF